ncbi:MAG: cache domain-containing protein [Desulfuromonadales bacterium]
MNIVTFFRNLSILPKIMLISIVSVFIVALTLLVYILPLFERKILDEKKIATRNVVEVAFRAVEECAEREKKGEISAEEARNLAIRSIRGMRYQTQEYFWINDLTPRMIMHPTRPELDGADLREHKDPHGKYLFVEFVKTAQQNGSGFVEYLWPKPGNSEPIPKISYVKLFKPWGWIVGSGIYLDDVQHSIARMRWTVIGITFSLSLLLLLISFTVGLDVTRPLDKVVASLNEIAKGEGDLTKRLEIEHDDEAGALANSFNQLNEKLVDIVRQIHSSSGELARISADIRDVSKQGVTSARIQADNVITTVTSVTEIDSSLKEVGRNVNGLSVFSRETAASIHGIVNSIESSAGRVELLKSCVDEVTASIEQIAGSIRTLGITVSAQYQATATTATSVAQMDVTSRLVQKKATRSAETASQVLADAHLGKESVDATIEGIRKIHDAARTTSAAIQSLTGRINDIGSILTVISDVTERTHLLSLNASLIAAQAGVHGKGFAVVAFEVKDLAEKTRISTRKIDAVIRNVQAEAGLALQAMSNAERCIQEGADRSRVSGEALAKIVDGVQSSRQQTNEIVVAMDEQAAGSQVILQAMEQVSAMIAENSNAIIEQETAVGHISESSEKMLGLAAEVLDSTRSQNIAGKQIASSVKSVTEMIAQIKNACDEQSTGSGYIINSVENIRVSSDVNLRSMMVLDSTIERLSQQIELLEKQVGRFVT